MYIVLTMAIARRLLVFAMVVLTMAVLTTTCKAAIAEYAAALAQEGGGTDEVVAQAAALSLSPTPKPKPNLSYPILPYPILSEHLAWPWP